MDNADKGVTRWGMTEKLVLKIIKIKPLSCGFLFYFKVQVKLQLPRDWFALFCYWLKQHILCCLTPNFQVQMQSRGVGGWQHKLGWLGGLEWCMWRKRDLWYQDTGRSASRTRRRHRSQWRVHVLLRLRWRERKTLWLQSNTVWKIFLIWVCLFFQVFEDDKNSKKMRWIIIDQHTVMSSR